MIGLENDSELQQVDADINDVRTQNMDLDERLIELQNDVSGLDDNIKQHTQDNELLRNKTSGLHNDLAYMRRQLVHTLSNVPLPTTNETLREDNFASYMLQLRDLCLDNYTVDNKDLRNAVKQALSAIAV